MAKDMCFSVLNFPFQAFFLFQRREPKLDTSVVECSEPLLQLHDYGCLSCEQAYRAPCTTYCSPTGKAGAQPTNHGWDVSRYTPPYSRLPLCLRAFLHSERRSLKS